MNVTKLLIGAPDDAGHLYYSNEKFDENGNLGIYSLTPLSDISSYGAGTLQTDIYEYYVSAYYTSLPMINNDGIYDIVFTDLFGQTYTQQLSVELFGNSDIEFKVSDTEYTNKDVIVTAKALNGGDFITSISAVINGTTKEELKEIIKEWMNRTGFNLKLVEIKDVHQREDGGGGDGDL